MMGKLRNNQKGFGTVEIILIVVIVALIGVVGWFVYKNHNKTTPSSTTTANTTSFTPTKTTTTPKSVDPTVNWLEYKATHYTIKFADGWVIMKKQSSNDSFFTTDNNDLKYKAGQKAVVKDYVQSGPGEFTYGFYIDYNDQSSNTGKCSGRTDLKLAFKTDGGNEVYTQTATGGDTTSDVSNLSKGDKYYGYCVQLGNSTLVFGYTLAAGTENNSSTVEQVVKTVKVN